MSSSVVGRDQRVNLGRALLCVGMLVAVGCAAEEAGSEDEVRAEVQQQIGSVTRNPGTPGVTRNPVTPVTPVTPPPVTPSRPDKPSSAGFVGPIQRCTNLGSLELATCQQSWAQLPGGRALLNLGSGLTDVHYKLIGVGNRKAYIQGDIIIGDEGSIRAADGLEAAARVSTGMLWPDGRIPYEIDSAVADHSRVTKAIAAWEAVTSVRFVLRTTETDYARVVDGAGCSSYVGRVGGMQEVELNSGCSVGNTIHELGHLIALWHEQSRNDRDTFVQIHLDNVVAGNQHNFDTIAGNAGSSDVSTYNFGSIMHYPLDAFASDKTKPTISVRSGVTVPPGVVIGQRGTLSDGDVTAVNLIYCYSFGGARCR